MATKKKTSKSAPQGPTLDEIRAARGVLEQAVLAYSASLSTFDVAGDTIRQVQLATVREFGVVADMAEKFGELFKAVALGVRERVDARIKLLTEDPTSTPDDTPVEVGTFALTYRKTAGRASISWRDKAIDLRVQVAELEGEDFGPEQGEAWAKATTEAAPKGPASYTPQIEVRG